METGFDSLGGGGGSKEFGRSEAHTTISDTGDVNFGGGGRIHELTVLGLAALGTLALLVALATQLHVRR